MTEQATLWQEQQQSNQFAELCSALYERELMIVANLKSDNAKAIQAKLKSLPYYVQKTAHQMINSATSGPLDLDSQNATWSTKQSRAMPLAGQNDEDVSHWYQQTPLKVGLVLPIKRDNCILLDCIDRVDMNGENTLRFRTNVFGWFSTEDLTKDNIELLKPTKKVMSAACAGHSWQSNGPCRPIIPSLRELLLSCTINWGNLKKTLPVKR